MSAENPVIEAMSTVNGVLPTMREAMERAAAAMKTYSPHALELEREIARRAGLRPLMYGPRSECLSSA